MSPIEPLAFSCAKRARFIFACFLALKGMALPVHCIAQLDGYISRPAAYCSGTNSSFSAGMNAEFGGYITWADMYVKDTTTNQSEITASYTYAPGNPQYAGWSTSVAFDSTSFADGDRIVVGIEAMDNFGMYGYLENRQVPVYNKGYVFGNVDGNIVPGGIGDLSQGYAAATYVSARLRGVRHTVAPNGNQCAEEKNPNIIPALPIYTVFYGWSHGTTNGGDAFGDSAAFANDGELRMQEHWFLPGDVSNAIDDATLGKTAKQYPPYNFVFSDSCSLGSDGNMALGFNIANSDIDRAFLGWPTTMGYVAQCELVEQAVPGVS